MKVRMLVLLPHVYQLGKLFSVGNEKLGPHVLTFSLPAISTCPGRSKFCEKLCYATRGHFRRPSVTDKYYKNWKATKHPLFVREAIAFMNEQGEALFRLHVSGDFYSAIYAKKWLRILKACPHIRCWVYTRSWRRASIAPTIREIAKLPNVQMWYSCDHETGQPKRIPKNIRLAYMTKDDADYSNYRADLIFRDSSLRKGVAVKHLNGMLVCPVENGVTHTTCEKCQICFRPEPVPRFNISTPKRIALTVV